MDILYGTSCLPAFRRTEILPTNQRPSGVLRLFLAVAVIAAIVGLLGGAAAMCGKAPAIAEVTAPVESGVSP